MHPQGSPDKWEVIEEDKVEVKGQVINPDYGFRLNEKKKFFVEVKRPYINIESGISPAYQLRRYGWSSNLSVSILTDFEEFSVYFCGSRPFQDDKATKGRLFYLRYDQYDEKWDQIASRFSREAVLGGSLEKIVENIRKTKGDIPVNAALLDDISKWRDMLARNIALRNASISQQDLNFAVQRIIDRILFLRICEDRAIEEEGRLRSLAEGKDIHSGLIELFKEADQRYNSGIFYFKEEKDRKEEPDRITPGLSIDDQVLKEIIDNLYYPNSPYVFSKIPAEILGQVYEQFLGKVIRLTEGHHAKVEDKPEVRKAGGVYYTPSYIVDYIVKNTVGKLLEGKTPADAAALRILDPACGSGSFLIGAYQYLLDWHKEWYISNLVPVLEKAKSPTDPGVLKLLPESIEKPNRARSRRIWARAAEAMIPVEKEGNDSWRLTTSERKRILLNNIYGVDIDFQAVEVTKLSLLLKVLEGETKETISNLQRFFKERALPDLGENIKCGNSLIGYDYYDDNLHLSEEEAKRINAFDWKTGFPDVFDLGGFDAVIGNPPYIQLSMAEYYDQNANCYFTQKYSSSMGRLNTFGLFIERSITLFIKSGGFLSFIVPNTLLTQEYYQQLRLKLLEYKLESITAYEYPVFDDAVVETIVVVVKKTERINNTINIILFDNESMSLKSHEIEQNLYCQTHKNSFLLNIGKTTMSLKNKLDKTGVILKEIANINQAIALKHDRSKSLFKENHGNNFKPVLDGRNIQRYLLNWGGYYLDYDIKNIHSCKRTDIFETGEKLFFRRVGDRLIATYDDEKFYALNTLVVITLKSKNDLELKYLLGLINSNLFNYYYVTYLKSTKRVFSEIQARQLAQLPIRTIDFLNPADVTRHDHMVAFVQSMLDLHKKLASATGEQERTLLKHRIEATDLQIDRLVYELYDLTEEEIAIVEGK